MDDVRLMEGVGATIMAAISLAAQRVEQMPQRACSCFCCMEAVVMFDGLKWVIGLELRAHANHASVVKIFKPDDGSR